MVHAAIFDNRQNAGGHNIYETTPGFPESYKNRIFQVCDRMQIDDYGRWALRYAPLGDLFLLTVCFRRREGSDFQERAHCQGVNFLLDRREANALLAEPLRAEDVVAMAEQCFKENLAHVSEAWAWYLNNMGYQRNMKADATDLPAEMWEPLLHSCVTHGKNSQLFVDYDDPELLLYIVHEYLPPHLRIGLPFLINSVALKECHDVELIFCLPGYLDTIKNSQDGQGLYTDKIFLQWDKQNRRWIGADQRKATQVNLVKNLRTLMEEFSPNVTDTLLSSIHTWKDLEEVCKVTTQKSNLHKALEYLAKQNPNALWNAINRLDERDPALAEIYDALEKATTSDGKRLKKDLKKEQQLKEKNRKKLEKQRRAQERGRFFRRMGMRFRSPRVFAFLFVLLAVVQLVFNHFRIAKSSLNSVYIVITASGYYSLLELLVAFLAGGAMFYALFSRRSNKNTTEENDD